MTMIKIIRIFIIFIILSGTSYAASSQYLLMIDAGSSGSRAHLLEYQLTSRVPVIKNIFMVSNKEPLASFADNPERAGPSIKKLLDQVQKYNNQHGINSSDITVNIMATAGMRLIPEAKQNAIYAAMRTYLATNSPFLLGVTKTISGQSEALYGWLNVNYLLGNFVANKATVGTIDNGGASVEIAYVTTDKSKPQDIVTVNLNNQIYSVFSKSFLGLGIDQARATMTTDKNAEACYPQGYTVPGKGVGAFDYAACRAIYSELIARYQVKEQLATIPSQMFVGFSGIFYTFDFFKQTQNPGDGGIESSINSVCYQTWAQLKLNYATVIDKYLSAECADATYQEQLVFHTYGIGNGMLTITNQINQQEIDWVLGAALFELTQTDIKRANPVAVN